MMTTEEIKSRIDLIRASGRDYETAHEMEDQLLWDFVERVANGGDDAPIAEMALLLLEWGKESAHEPRYCA